MKPMAVRQKIGLLYTKKNVWYNLSDDKNLPEERGRQQINHVGIDCYEYKSAASK
jgi:hypothetical protein